MLGFSAIVPADVVNQWGFRHQYIGQGELLAGPVAATVFADELAQQDVLWFIDNTSALAPMIKGASGCEDNPEMALVAALALSRPGCRTWYERVPSESNPSDPLSREGLQDPWVRQLVSQRLLVMTDARPNWAQCLRRHVIPW